jgi:MFS family permease
VAAWIGRGSRSAARDVLMTEGSTPETRGKAFGLERAADAVGAVLGPLLAMALLAWGFEARRIVIVSLLPGLLAFLAIALLVAEGPHEPRAARFDLRGEWAGVGGAFRRYLRGILLFGMGDFSRTLLILYATQSLSGPLFSMRGATAAVALYVLHNAVSAAAAFPIGALADRVGHGHVVVGGYVFAAATTLGFAVAPPTPLWLVTLFVASGLYIACEEVAEKSYAATLLPPGRRGAGMGLLAAVNGVGDMVSSALVGSLWLLSPGHGWGFTAAALLQLLGALAIASTLASRPPAST